ncbi:MAG: Ku protein [Peptostreptococcales bacterium]
MMMHTVFKGSISFGLVNIPIKMFAATEEKDIRFRTLHKKCHSPIKYEKKCPHCNEEVKQEDLVKGFEYEPGKFVIILEEDIEAAKEDVKAHTIEILDFVNLDEIDPIYFDKTYYIAPQPESSANAKAYNLLREAMKQSNRIAISQLTMRNKQILAALRVFNNVVILETLFYPDEVRPVSEVPALPEDTTTDKKEMEIASMVIDNLTAKFDPGKYKDNYREALRNVIENKIKGKQTVTASEAPQTSNVIDLMEALQASLKETEKSKPKEANKAKTTAKDKITAKPKRKTGS